MKIKKIGFQKSNSTQDRDSDILNPELEGGSFFWKGSEIGILLLHGLTATTAEVRPLAKNLFKEGYTVSGILLPGHGTTPEKLSQTHREDWIKASEVAYYKLKRECKSVIVGGESVGALLALRLACEHPEIKGLLLYAPAIQLGASFLKILFFVVLSPFVFSVKKKIPKDREGLPWQGYKVNPLKTGVQLLKFQFEIKKLLHRIYQPILIIQASLDETIDLNSGDIILRGVQSAVKESYWMKKSGHVVILEKEFEEVFKKTINFIKRVFR
ncbi:MAG: hypothetical protein CL935_05175 [Deltaproteobacteria bacterium]|nr:hypothetical protein [Deltaproteobacteria bacterium]|tara:strand:+ start:736 stop:1545 length:810 start_codon:yes stop_codon:yes gene_type:complete